MSDNEEFENINFSKEYVEDLKKKNKKYLIKIKNLELKNDKIKKNSFYYQNKKKAKLEKQNTKLLNTNIKLKSENFSIKSQNKNINKLNLNKEKIMEDIKYYDQIKNNIKNNYFEQLDIYSDNTKDSEYKSKIFEEINNLINYVNE